MAKARVRGKAEKLTSKNVPPAVFAAAAARPGDIRTGLIAKSFSLELYQDLTNPPHSDSLRIVAYTDNGDLYRLAPSTVTDPSVASVAAAVLARIARNQLQSGWKFDGIYYPSSQSGTITG